MVSSGVVAVAVEVAVVGEVFVEVAVEIIVVVVVAGDFVGVAGVNLAIALRSSLAAF